MCRPRNPPEGQPRGELSPDTASVRGPRNLSQIRGPVQSGRWIIHKVLWIIARAGVHVFRGHTDMTSKSALLTVNQMSPWLAPASLHMADLKPTGAHTYIVWGCSTLGVPVTQAHSPVFRAHGAPIANGGPQ